MWLGEQITERGIGNGISLIIFCGIVVGIPRGIMQSMDLIKSGSMSIFLAVIIVLLMAAVLTAIVFVERAQRRIPHQLRQAPDRTQDVWRPEHAPAPARQYGGRHPAHFRLVAAAVPGHGGPVLHQ